MLGPAQGTLIGKANHATPGNHRDDAIDAKFDGFLHRHVHLVPGLQRLYQGDRKRRLTLGGQPLQDLHADPQALDAGDPSRILAAGAREQGHRIATSQPQNLDRMLRDDLRQIDLRADRQRHGAMEAGRTHHGIIRASPFAVFGGMPIMALNTPVCDFGWPAVDFELADTNGARHSLSTLRGPNGLLLMFICNHCPYVKAIIDRICRDARALQGQGIGVAAIMSNDPAEYPEDSLENMQRVAAQLDFPFPYLYDATQDVARRYGAVCTPDFFGFNRQLELHYRGRLDASGRMPAAPDARRELVEAMRLVAETGRGPAEQVASMGCSIKWRS